MAAGGIARTAAQEHGMAARAAKYEASVLMAWYDMTVIECWEVLHHTSNVGHSS